MIYEKSNSISGNWLKGQDVVEGSKCKLVSETVPIKSNFKDAKGNDKTQDVAKIQFQGKEPLNISINRASINALVDAFGNDSVKWQGHVLTAHVEKVMVSGRRVSVIYLIPEGYEVMEDANGYVVIVKKGTPVESLEDDPEFGGHVEDTTIRPEDIRF